MAVHSTTRSADLREFIRMTEEGLQWQRENENGAQDPKMVAKLAEYKAELATIVASGVDRPGMAVATGEGEGTPVRLTDRPAAGARAANQFGEFQVHYASAKQTAFIRSLMDRKDLSPLADSVTIDVARLREQVAAQQVNKKAASAIIDRLLALPDAQRTATPTAAGTPVVARPASEKQVALIKRLAAERDWQGLDGANTFAAPGQLVAMVLSGIVIGVREASAAIDFLFGCAKAARPAATRELGRDDAGVYILADGTMIRVYYGQQSGRMLAKKVTADSTLEYIGQADRHLVGNFRKATLEEAGAFGRTTGTCIHCGLALDDPESVDRGIGPVCYAKHYA